MHIKVDDRVQVIAGNDNGRTGRVLSVDHQAGKLVVEKVNLAWKHVRRSQKNPQGGRLHKEMPVQISNVLLVCEKCNQATRTGARYLDDGSKERYCKKCGGGLGQLSPPREAYAKK